MYEFYKLHVDGVISLSIKKMDSIERFVLLRRGDDSNMSAV